MSGIDIGCITAADAEQDEDWLDFDTPRSQPLVITPRSEPSLIQPRHVGQIPPSREWLGGDLLRLSRDEDGSCYSTASRSTSRSRVALSVSIRAKEDRT